MDIRVDKIPLSDYARDVLPHSAALWAGGRSFERYVADLREFVSSGYGKRRFKLVGIRSGGEIVSSCKRYEREVRCGERMLRAVGIGAVFTREDCRGRGLATTLLAALLDAEREAGSDVAFLFSDIRPHFYEELGFASLPSRSFTIRANSLPFERIKPVALRDADWREVARCFRSIDVHRPIALRRTPLIWELMRSWFRITPRSGNASNLVIRSGERVLAYCLGRRDVAADAYVVDEFAFAGVRNAHLIPPLLRAAAGDLRKITGWLPPAPARDVLPAGSVRARKHALLMAAPLSSFARARFRAEAERIARASGDLIWHTDHI
ncbi:MAG: GNAT family N-acetyltransferase, partial [Polyangiaceae bacterium]